MTDPARSENSAAFLHDLVWRTPALLEHSESVSTDELVIPVIAFINDYSCTAAPLRWTDDGRPPKIKTQ